MSVLTLDAIVATAGARRFGPISHALAPGARLALVGPSGTGKTTLLRAIAGLHPIASGSLWLGHDELSAWPPERRRLVYLHQTPRLFPHLDVLGNVALAQRVAGDPAAERDARRWLAAVRLDARANASVEALSGGERQRVALARALAAAPRALLLDEPFSGLDPSLRREVREAVEKVLEANGPAAILVSHDLDEAAAFASAVVTLLADGSSWAGDITTLMHRPPTLAHARFVGVENLVAPGLLPADHLPGAATIGCRASALAALPAADGTWQVERTRPTERGYRVHVRSAAGGLTAVSDAPLERGATVRVAADSAALLGYDAAGHRLDPH